MAPEANSASRPLRFSLSLKLTLGLVLMIGIVFAASTTYAIVRQNRAQRLEALLHAETIARILAGALVAELANSHLESDRNRNFLHNILRATLEANPRNRDLAYALVMNPTGHVVAGRAKPELTVLPGEHRPKTQEAILHEIASLRGRLGGLMRSRRFPLRLGDRDVGLLIVGISFARVQRELSRQVFLSVVVLIGTLILLLVYALFALRVLVIRPLNAVVNAMGAVRRGDLRQHIATQRQDELGVLAHTYNFMVEGLRERALLQDAFTRYVSDKVYEKVRAGEINLQGENRTATVLFSDIRSFTSISERLTPPQVVAMLNEYFSAMVEVVIRYDGVVNKFIGDALMAIYNVPVPQSRPELRAVCTALDMIASLGRLNAAREARGDPALEVGIGINTGPVVAGNIGHRQRLEYTVIGDAVNLAQRIESQTKLSGHPVLISASTYRAVADAVEAEALEPVQVKGKAQPIALYAVRSLRAEARPDVIQMSATFATPSQA